MTGPATGRDVRATSPSELQVRGLSDQQGEPWLEVERNGKRGRARLALLQGGSPVFWTELLRQGVVILSAGTRTALAKQAEAVTDYPAALNMLTRPGLHGGIYVKPDGSIFGARQGVEWDV